MAEKDSSVASLQRRMFEALTLVSVLAAIVSVVAATFVFRSSIVADAHVQLARECAVVGSLVEESADPVASLSALDFGDARVTLIAADGTVVFDNKVAIHQLSNHSDRPEVEQAQRNGTGASERQSQTLGFVSIYEAVRLDDGRVLRIAEDRAGVLALLWSSVGMVFAVLASMIVLSWFASRALARRLVRPILEIDPTEPDAEAPYRELAPLVSHLKTQNAQLEDQMERLRDADAVRQEFTSNVTHELKTPIASIMGASELIRDGIVRPDDIPDFAARIYGDARRLSALVSDILTLSKLDETERSRDRGLLGQAQKCDLFMTARDACDRLGDRAQAGRVMLTLDGDVVAVRGYPRLLDELVGNLIDNAIRYNVMGGSVAVTVGTKPGGAPFVRVKDTGVGIPEEDQQKVFERFYRVDKSRSRASGGTGLGLAIVKHAAKVHGATINMQSTFGKGTTIEVTFPPYVEAPSAEELEESLRN
jgi:two-component system phosphate regulon sensor histidine kinase PhoR